MKNADFQVDVTFEDALCFADQSGDWNPLHTDLEHAANTTYKKPILHGAYSAGLISRMAGMYIPGRDCLLHNMRLRFIAPIIPPATLTVSGKLVSESWDVGKAEVSVSDKNSGVRYVEASYDFGRHDVQIATGEAENKTIRKDHAGAVTLVTGASGGVGSALLRQLGSEGLGVSRDQLEGGLCAPDLLNSGDIVGNRPIKGIVHCAWPMPDNTSFSKLDKPLQSINYHIAEPLGHIQALSRLLIGQGEAGAPLVLFGSTFASAGRHNFRMPLYSLAKSMIPTLSNILAMEYAPYNRRCISVIFDVIDGGMNKGMSEAMRLSHGDRSPAGVLASPEDAATQIMWVLENQSNLISGACVSLSGGAMP